VSELHLLPLSAYPFVLTLRPRIGDVDSLRHLNNVAIADYYFEGRVAFIQSVAGGDTGPGEDSPDRPRILVRRVEIDYRREGYYPDELTMGVGVIGLGTSSFTMGFILLQREVCIGTSTCVMVTAALRTMDSRFAGFRRCSRRSDGRCAPSVSARRLRAPAPAVAFPARV